MDRTLCVMRRHEVPYGNGESVVFVLRRQRELVNWKHHKPPQMNKMGNLHSRRESHIRREPHKIKGDPKASFFWFNQ